MTFIRLGVYRSVVGTTVLMVGALCWCDSHAEAQTVVGDEAWRWVHFTTESGLPSNRVFHVVETTEGTAWVGTESGVAWFDGYRWIPVGDAVGLPASRSQVLALAPNDEILVVIAERLYRGDTTGFRPIPVEEAGIPQPVKTAVALPDGGILILAGRSLYRFHADTLEPYTSPELPDPGARGAWRGERGTVWLGDWSGLYRWDRDQWVRTLPVRSPDIRLLAEDGFGRGLMYLWFPQSHRGLWEWEEGGTPRRHSVEGRDVIVAMDIAPSGDAIVASGSGDIRVKRAGTWSTFLPGSPAKNVLVLKYRDNSDVWVGTERGLFLYRQSSTLWTYWKHEQPSLKNSLHEIIRARDGSVWLATAHGVEIHRPDGTIESIDRIGGRGLGGVTGLAEDENGHVWISSGGSFAGAYRSDGARWRHFGVREGLAAPRIHKIRMDRRGRLWFLGMAETSESTESRSTGQEDPGAFVYDEGRFTRWGTTDGLFARACLRVCRRGGGGSLWFGTTHGLSRWKDGEWTYWTAESGLHGVRVFTLAIDNANRVWFGHQTGGGLGFIDEEGHPRYLTTADGLVNGEVWDLSVDARGKLWIVTAGGLASYQDGIWSTFGYDAGLSSLHVWPVLPLADRVYVGTRGSGVDILLLDEARRPPPRVVVNSLVDDDRVLMSWNAYAHWGALPPNQIPTRSRMDNGPWSDWGIEREATISDIAAGTHSVEVQAKGWLGELGPPARAMFTVPLPIFLRPVFLAPMSVLALLLAGSGTMLVVRRRRYEASLRKSKERYQDLYDNAPDMYLSIDAKTTRILACNNTVVRMLGYPRDEIVGRSVVEFYHPDCRDYVKDVVRETCRRTGEVHDAELRVEREDGSVIDVSLNETGERNAQGDIVVCRASWRDITERKQAEVARKVKAEQVRTILNSTADGLISMDERGIIWMFNPAAEAMFGYRAAEVLGRNVRMLMPSPYHEEHDGYLTRYHDTGERRILGREREAEGKRKDGSTFPLALRVREIWLEGDRHFLGTTQDITERKLAEEALRASRAQLEALSGHLFRVREDERTQMARDVHDELAQIMTALKMDLSWLNDQLEREGDTLAEKTAAMLTLVDKTIGFGKRLIERLRPSVLDGLGLVAAIEWQAEEFARRCGVECRVQVDSEPLPLDDAASTAIFRILQEVLTNVIRHAEASRVDVTLRATDVKVVLKVRDNGRGISRAELDDARAFGVIGMRERARALGGSVVIRGRPKRGTTVTATFPARAGVGVTP